MANKTTIMDMDRLSDQLETARRNYLRERGWEYTSSTPGCIWLWQKTLPDGRVMLVDESTAMYVEEASEPIEDTCFECGGTGPCECYCN